MFHCPNFDALTVLGKASDTYKSIVILKACQILYKMSTIPSRFDGDDKISHRQIPYTYASTFDALTVLGKCLQPQV